jgi:hypothetical protein
MEEERKEKLAEQLEKKKQIDIDKKKVQDHIRIEEQKIKDKKKKQEEAAAIKAYKEQERRDAFEREQDKKIYEENQRLAQNQREKEKEKEKLEKKFDDLMNNIIELSEAEALLFIDEDYDEIIDYYKKIKKQLNNLIDLYNINKKDLDDDYKVDVKDFISTNTEQLKELKQNLDKFKSKKTIPEYKNKADVDELSVSSLEQFLIDTGVIVGNELIYSNVPPTDTKGRKDIRWAYNAYMRKKK